LQETYFPNKLIKHGNYPEAVVFNLCMISNAKLFGNVEATRIQKKLFLESCFSTRRSFCLKDLISEYRS
jgi:hypothetical protein